MNSDEQGKADESFNDFGGFWTSKPSERQSTEELVFDNIEELLNSRENNEDSSTKGNDIIINMNLTFMESINGYAKKEITVEKKGWCHTCHGSKCKAGTSPSKCNTCVGRGVVNHRKGAVTSQIRCTVCKGGGVIIKHTCQTCKGVGIIPQHSKENIAIPKGIKNGQCIKLTGKVKASIHKKFKKINKGNVSENNGSEGDLIIKMVVKPDDYFKRNGYDIHTDCYITISKVINYICHLLNNSIKRRF